MINTVTVAGNLGKDPELVTTEGGLMITRFSIAVNEIRGKGDERKTTTHWIDCVAFGQLADTISKYVVKGSKVTVQGRLNQRKWENEAGQMMRRVVVIVERIEFMSRQSTDSGDQEAEVTEEFAEASAA